MKIWHYLGILLAHASNVLKFMANNHSNTVTGSGAVDPSAVASVVTGVLNAMGFQQSSGAINTHRNNDSQGDSGSFAAAGSNSSRN